MINLALLGGRPPRRRRGGVSFTTITDSFNRADSAVTMGSTDGGQVIAWTALDGVWGIQTNRAYIATDGGANKSAVVIDSGVADCTLQVTITSNSAARLCWRASDVDNFFILDIGGSDINIYRRQAGSYSGSIGTSATAVANGDVIAIVLSANSHTVKVNGVTKINITDAFNQTATKHGLAAAGLGPTFDVFSITVP